MKNIYCAIVLIFFCQNICAAQSPVLVRVIPSDFSLIEPGATVDVDALASTHGQVLIYDGTPYVEGANKMEGDLLPTDKEQPEVKFIYSEHAEDSFFQSQRMMEAQARLTTPGFEGAANYRFDKTRTTSANAVTIRFTGQLLFRRRYIKEVSQDLRFGSPAAEILMENMFDEGLDAASRQRAAYRFKKHIGTHYVQSVVKGARIDVLFTLKGMSESMTSSMAAGIEMAYNSGFTSADLTAAYSESMKAMRSSKNLTVTVHASRGVDSGKVLALLNQNPMDSEAVRLAITKVLESADVANAPVVEFTAVDICSYFKIMDAPWEKDVPEKSARMRKLAALRSKTYSEQSDIEMVLRAMPAYDLAAVVLGNPSFRDNEKGALLENLLTQRIQRVAEVESYAKELSSTVGHVLPTMPTWEPLGFWSTPEIVSPVKSASATAIVRNNRIEYTCSLKLWAPLPSIVKCQLSSVVPRNGGYIEIHPYMGAWFSNAFSSGQIEAVGENFSLIYTTDPDRIKNLDGITRSVGDGAEKGKYVKVVIQYREGDFGVMKKNTTIWDIWNRTPVFMETVDDQ